MNLIDILFCLFTIPGLYIAGVVLTYKIVRKLFFTEPSEIEDAKVCAGLWVLAVPFMLVIVFPFCMLEKLFEMLEGKNGNQSDGVSRDADDGR